MATSVGGVSVFLHVDSGPYQNRMLAMQRLTSRTTGSMRADFGKTAAAMSIMDQRSREMQSRGFMRGLGASVSRESRVALIALEGLTRQIDHVSAGLAGGVVIGLAARGFQNYADAATTLENKLAVVTEREREREQVARRLFLVAQDARTSIEATADAYTRAARSAEDLGRSQQFLIRASETVQKGLITGGATGQEASAGSIQLFQGIASNRLQGDELRSVLENAPALARALASNLRVVADESVVAFDPSKPEMFAGSTRVTIGNIRELAKEGKLTGQVLLDALVLSSDQIEAEFQRTQSTIAQGWTVVNNAAKEYVRTNDTLRSTSVSVASGLKGVADKFEAIADAVGLIAALGAASAIAKIGNGFIASSQQAALYRNTLRAAYDENVRFDQQRVASAQVAARATQAELNFRRALTEGAVTSDARVAALQRERAAKVAAASATGQLAVAEARLAASQSAAAATAATLTLSARLLTTTMSVLRGTVSFLGGPLGLAAIAGTALYLSDATDSLATRMQKLNRSLDENGAKLDRVARMDREIKGLKKQLEQASIDYQDELGNEVSAARAAADGEIAQLERRLKKREELRRAILADASNDLGEIQGRIRTAEGDLIGSLVGGGAARAGMNVSDVQARQRANFRVEAARRVDELTRKALDTKRGLTATESKELKQKTDFLLLLEEEVAQLERIERLEKGAAKDSTDGEIGKGANKAAEKKRLEEVNAVLEKINENRRDALVDAMIAEDALSASASGTFEAAKAAMEVEKRREEIVRARAKAEREAKEAGATPDEIRKIGEEAEAVAKIRMREKVALEQLSSAERAAADAMRADEKAKRDAESDARKAEREAKKAAADAKKLADERREAEKALADAQHDRSVAVERAGIRERASQQIALAQTEEEIEAIERKAQAEQDAIDVREAGRSAAGSAPAGSDVDGIRAAAEAQARYAVAERNSQEEARKSLEELKERIAAADALAKISENENILSLKAAAAKKIAQEARAASNLKEIEALQEKIRLEKEHLDVVDAGNRAVQSAPEGANLELIRQKAESAERYEQSIKRSNEALKKQEDIHKKYAKAVEKFAEDQAEAAKTQSEAIERDLKKISDATIDNIANAESWADALKSVAAEFAKLALQPFVTGLFGQKTSATGLGAIFGDLGQEAFVSIMGGSAPSSTPIPAIKPTAGSGAAGLFAQAGKSYRIGEHGPETFTPAMDGYVTPANFNPGSGDVNVTNKIFTSDPKTRITSTIERAPASRQRQTQGAEKMLGAGSRNR